MASNDIEGVDVLGLNPMIFRELSPILGPVRQTGQIRIEHKPAIELKQVVVPRLRRSRIF